MNILHIIDSMDPAMGGVCQAVRTIIDSTSVRSNIHNEVVSLDSLEAKFLANDSRIIHALGPAKGPWSYSPNLIPWLSDNVGRFNIVIVHGLWQYHTFAIQKVLKSQRQNKRLFKVFSMPHGMLDPYFQKAQGRKLKAIRNTVYWKLIENKLIEQSDGILFTSEDELLLAREPFKPYSPKSEQVVGLGIVPPPPFDASMSGAFFDYCPEVINQEYILFLGRINSKKGVDILLDAYSKLCIESKNTENIPRLVIAGPGLETTYGKMIHHQVTSSPVLTERVHFTGMLSGDSKWGAYYHCSAFILPSHQENFGISVVESLACGKPVLISDKINIWREILSMNACFVDSDTVAGTYSSLSKWCSLSDHEIKVMSENSYECFNKYFVADSTAERLINFFSSYEQ